MAFTIYSGIPGRVVSVQVDEVGMFNVMGNNPLQPVQVNLKYAQVHVAGLGPNSQAQRVVGIENGSNFEVLLLNDRVRVAQRP